MRIIIRQLHFMMNFILIKVRSKVIVSHRLSAEMASFGESQQLVLTDEAFK